MGSRPLRLTISVILALALPPAALRAGRRPPLKEEMKFGVEAAQQGLWREAIFRWEKVLPVYPESARLRNNLAVAYESLGQFDRALSEYKEAHRLEPDNREIRDNYESFVEFSKSLKGSAPGPATTPPPAPVPPGGGRS
jgi:Tfp pilus assembly protein PilF